MPALAPTPESSGETELPSDMVDELVMEALSTPDQVAYIRFTSVYRNFREAKDLGEFLGRIAPDDNQAYGWSGLLWSICSAPERH